MVGDEPDPKYTGRGAEPEYEMVSVWPVCAKEFGTTSVEGRAKQLLVDLLGR